MALGIEASGLQTAAFQRAAPHPSKQMVIDIAVGAGSEEDQSVGVIETQLLHLLLVLLEDFSNQWRQRHQPLLACLGGSPDVLSGGIPVSLEGLVNQDFAVIPTEAVPSQSPDFGITHSSAHPQQEERVIPVLVGLEVLEHCLDFSGSEHIALHFPFLDFQGVGKQMAVASRALAAVHQHGADGVVG